MAFDPVTGGEELAGKIIDALSSHFPTPEDKEKAQLAILQALQTGDASQNAVNTAEAQNPHLFVAGWRPFIGWVCGIVLAVAYIPKVIVLLTIWVYVCLKTGNFAPPPSFDISDVLTLVMSLLGLGAMKSFDQWAGTATTGFSWGKK